MWSQFKAQGLAQTQNWRRAIGGVRRSGRILASSVLLIFTAFSISAWAQTTINAGDIVVVFGNAFGGSGGIYKIDPATGAQTPLACNPGALGCPITGTPGFFSEPVSLAIEATGNIVVADRVSGVIRVNPQTGAQTLLAASSTAGFIDPFGITVGDLAVIYITDTGCATHGTTCPSGTANAKIFSINPGTGAAAVVSSGQFLLNPFGIDAEVAGTLVVTDAISGVPPFTGAGGIIRINPALLATANQTPVHVGTANADGCPFGIAVDRTAQSIYTSLFHNPSPTDSNDPPPFPPLGCSPGAIWRATSTGTNTFFSGRASTPTIRWEGPFGMVVDSNGSVLVVDEFYRALYRLNQPNASLVQISSFVDAPTDVDVYNMHNVPPGTSNPTLSVTKTDGVTTVTAGDNVTRTYTIVVTNSGTAPAINVTLTDTWPIGFNRTTLSCTPSSGTSTGNGNFTCGLGDLAGGSSTTVTASYTVPSSTGPGPQTNGVSVTSVGSNTATASDTDTVVTSVTLAATKTDGVTSVTAGDGKTYTYTITVTNNGPSDAQNVTLNDTWPSGFSRTSLSCAPATGTSTGNASFSCSLGTIPSRMSATVTASYTVPRSTPAGQQTNSVSASTTTQNSNTATASDTDTVNAPVPSADLSITKSGPGTVNTGASFAYMLTVSNAGPDPAMNLKVSDSLPAGVTFVSASGSGWTCSQSGGAVTCAEGSQAPGVTTTITINVKAPSQPGTITNTATVSSSTSDANPSNNQSSVTTTVVQPPPPTKWTGAGKIRVSGGYAEFAFNVRRRPDGTVQGQLEFENEVTKLDVHSISINTLTVSGQTATFTGTVYERVDHGPTKGPYNFSVTVQDNDQPPGPDVFKIQITDPYNTNEGGTLVRGKIEQQKWDSRDDRDDQD